MPKFRYRHAFVAVLLLVAMLAQGTWALASTTGGISGSVVDTATGAAVANATVTANSASQTATATTDAGGNFHFLTLAPDTYTVSATKTGYNSASRTGVTVFADQTFTMTIGITASLRTIANVTARAAGNLVKPGTTSDVYSVNAATQQVVSGSGGGFNLNQAYSGIYSQPGVTSYVGNYGWGQVFYIRGSAYSQIGYEFDGVPVNRAFDNYQANSLSTLGQQELQVYTGGSPAGASSATLGGFINQVIKTGTYPGFGTLTGGIGAPGFYHALTGEAGGSNPNRTFSYYVGIQGYNAHFPFGSWNNLGGINPNGSNSNGLVSEYEISNSYANLLCGINAGCPDGGIWSVNQQFLNGPWPACSPTTGVPAGYSAATPGVFSGTCNGYGPFGTAYLSDMYERDNVINLHFALPHRNDSGRDDLQLLYDNSMQYQIIDSSINDNGGLALLNGLYQPFATTDCGFGGPNCGSFLGNSFFTGLHPYTGPYTGLCGERNFFTLQGCSAGPSPIGYTDTYIWAPGTSFGSNAATAVAVPYYFPNSPANRPLSVPGTSAGWGVAPALRDGFWNDVGIVKAQYTKNIGTNAYARLFGYSFYSDWLISGPDAGATAYVNGTEFGGLFGETPDYELDTHTRGAEFQFADQLNAQNLLQFTANYTTASVARFNNSSFRSQTSSTYSGVTNLTNGNPANPMCFSATSGAQVSCFSSSSTGQYTTAAGIYAGPTHGQAFDPCAAGQLPAGSAACLNKATWQVTTPGGQGTYNLVQPVFTSAALTDEFKPNDRLDLNLGVRMETYKYNLSNTNTPEYNFWFNAEAQILCYDPGTGQPLFTPLAPGQPTPPSPKSTAPLAKCGVAPSGQEALHPVGNTALCNGTTTFDCGPIAYSANSPSSFTHTLYSPRFGMTYTFSPDDVLRISAGRYTQPTETAFEQYIDQSGKRAANFDFSRFWGLGFTTPAHDNPVQSSNNFDFSWEHHFHNTDVTMKVSPFYRYTTHEIVTLVLGPGFVSGTNVGTQKSYGVEVALQKGDPTRDGLSGQLSYTYTKALLQYGNLPNGTNAIDYLNNYITAFNKLTQGGGGAACYESGTADPTCTDITGDGTGAIIKNPYYTSSMQTLLDRNGWYNTYPNEPPNDPGDQGGTTAIWPHQLTAWVQYKHGRWAIAPNFDLAAGGYYGSPTDVYGVDPRACIQNESAATTASGGPVLPLGSPYGQNPDFLSCGASGFVESGVLAIPNPFTGKMDNLSAYQQPWIFNMGALIRYDISPRVTANLTLTNLVNRCFGGSTPPWAKAFPANNTVCGYGQNNGNYIGPTSSQPGFGGGFFYGGAPTDASNGFGGYPSAFNYPFSPLIGAEPFQAYLQVQVKI